jgi:hypothetical protein
MMALNWIPFAGPFIAGYKTGSMTGKSTRGLLAGFILGIFGILLLVLLFVVLGGVIGDILFGARGAAFGAIVSGIVSGIVLVFYSASDIFLCSLGGVVGGMMSETHLEERLSSSFYNGVMPRFTRAGRTLNSTENSGGVQGSSSSSSAAAWQRGYEMIVSLVGSKAGRYFIAKLIERIFSQGLMREETKHQKLTYKAYIDNIKAKTGKTPEEYRKMARQKGLTKYGELLKWLKGECGLGHGHANAIILYIQNPELGKKKIMEDTKAEGKKEKENSKKKS